MDGKVIATVSAPKPAPLHDRRTIGAVLVDAGRLKIEDAERILQLQRESNLSFGEAGLKLGLLSQADIDYALSRQFDHPYLQPSQSAVSTEVLAAYSPSAPQIEGFRALRSQLMLRWFDTEPVTKALAIISAERNEGRSFITANLAVVFSQLGERTLLVDADLRHPVQHRLFGLNNGVGLSTLLAERTGTEAVQRVPGLLNLSVLPAGPVPPNPQELLERSVSRRLLQQLAPHFDVILLDTPAASETADAQIIAIRSGAALIVARKNSARSWRVQGASDTVVQGKASIVGAVLNDF